MAAAYARAPNAGVDAIDRTAQDGPGAHDDWAAFINNWLCQFAIRSRRERSFQVGAHVRAEESFLAGRFRTIAGSALLERRAEEIRRDGHDRYALSVPLSGGHITAQFSRQAHCAPMAMTLAALAEPLAYTKLGDNDTVYLFLPRAFVDQRVASPEAICARTIGAENGLQRLARDAVIALQREADFLSLGEFCAAARTTAELALLAITGAGDLMSGASAVRAGNLGRVKQAIRARLSEPDLTLADVAGACGISLRYLHNLFRDDGRTAMEFIAGERLQRARRLLEAGSVAVTQVAMACGFSSPAQFATAFRRCFGVSPRDVRARQ